MLPAIITQKDTIEGEYIPNGEESTSTGSSFANVDPAVIKGMASFCFSVEGMREHMQTCLKLAAVQSHDHGEVANFSYILAKLESEERKYSRGVDVNAIVRWINQYTKAHVVYESQQKAHRVELRPSKESRFADAPQWWKCGKDSKNWTEFDAKDSLTVVLSRHSKMSKERMRLEKEGNKAAAELIHLDADLMRAVKALTSDRRMIELVINESEKLTSTIQ